MLTSICIYIYMYQASGPQSPVGMSGLWAIRNNPIGLMLALDWRRAPQ